MSVRTIRDHSRVERDVLKALVDEGLTTREIAAATDRSQTTVRHWLRRHGLKTARSRRTSELRGKYAISECRRHGRTRFVLEGRGYYRCTRCRGERVAARRRKVKELLVAEAGGACQVCGYDRYVGALHFHHLDPQEKRFGLAKAGVTIGIDRLRAEARKCALLCSNCHAEVEGGYLSATLVRQSESG